MLFSPTDRLTTYGLFRGTRSKNRERDTLTYSWNLGCPDCLGLVAQGNASCTTLSTRFQVLRGINNDTQDVQDRGECGRAGVV